MLREAAQQALEALEKSSPQGFYSCKCMGSQHWPHCYWKQHQDAITVLKAALAEPVLQTCNCRWDGEVQVQQCTLHEAHVDAIHEWAERAKTAEKKLAALAEPVQEPAAWRYQDARGNYRYRGYVQGFDKEYSLLKPVPLYAAPPQRKPLTDEEIKRLVSNDMVQFARAIERAHGIV